jgi:tellurium resistance protein TerZ
MVMSKLSRNGNVWNFQAIGTPANGRTAGDVLGAAAAAL